MRADPANPRRLGSALLLSFAMITAALYQGGQVQWLGVSLTALALWGLLRRRGAGPVDCRSRDRTALALAAFWLWLALTLAWSKAPASGLPALMAVAMAPLAYLGNAYGRQGERTDAWVLAAVLSVGLLLVALSLYEWIIGLPHPRSLFTNKNTHAGFLNLLLLPALAAFLISRGRLQWLLGATLFLLALSSALPGSRGALVALLAGLALPILAAWRLRLRRPLLIALALVAAGYAVGGTGTGNVSRLQTLSDPVTHDTGRWEIWEGALRLLDAGPWHGTGVGSFWLEFPPYRHPLDESPGFNAHNDYLQLAIEAGAPALLLLALALLPPLLRAYRQARQGSQARQVMPEVGAGGALVALLTHALISHYIYQAAAMLLAGLYLSRLSTCPGVEPAGAVPRAGLRRAARGAATLALLGAALLGASLTLSGALYQGAVVARQLDRPEAARRRLELVSRYLPHDERVPWLQARLLLDELRAQSPAADTDSTYRELQDRLARAVELNPLRPQLPYQQARTALLAGRPDPSGADRRAEELLQRSLTLDPRHQPARELLARLLYRSGRLREAHGVVVEGLRLGYQPSAAAVGYFDFAQGICMDLGDKACAARAGDLRASMQRRLQLGGERARGRAPVSPRASETESGSRE